MQTSFNGGEWTKLLEGRIDLEKYRNALYRMENFIIDPRGPAHFRPGFRFKNGTKTNASASRFIPFEFSTTQAYILEFGNNYIRFYRNQAQIQIAYAAWAGTTAYALGALVTNGGNYYRCIVAHTSTANFANDLASGYWVASAGATDLAYEIPSTYAAADVAGIKYCQSADVIYLFHSSYAPRKLSRTGHTAWTLTTINFRSPAVKEQGIKPAATLTLAAVTGNSILFTAGAAVFQSGDVNRIITSGAGRASITAYNSTTEVTCDIIDDFAAVGPIASQSWSLLGSPSGSITPSAKSPVGAIITITSSDAAEVFSNLLTAEDPPDDNWLASGSGTNEYYLVNTASTYQAAKPDAFYISAVAAVEGAMGSLGISQWDWGDNDALGYDTLYVRLSDGVDPDTKSTFATPDNDFLKCSDITAAADLFRSSDVGKYIRVHSGFVKITIYTSATVASGEILKELMATTATLAWTLESEVWNATNGYPSCGTFFEERLCLAGSLAYPETIWGSVVGDFENHTPGVDAADAFEFTITGKEVSNIAWIEPDEYLLLGSAGKISRLGPEDTGQALTPLNVLAKRQVPEGAAEIMPVAVTNAVLYVDRSGFDKDVGNSIRELTWVWENGKYVSPDLSLLAEHITNESKIAGIAYQRKPFSILWVYLEDGSLAAMTYLREQDVVGWHRHPVDNGEVESLASIPGDGYTEIWAIIKRTINGATVRYVEMMEAVFTDDDDTYTANKGLNAFFVDSGITYNGAAATNITGLSHLEGATVAVLADGAWVSNKVVNSGAITLATAAQVVHAGLPYTGTLQTMRLDAAMRDGTAQGRVKKIHSLIVRVYQSGPFKTGRDANNLDVCADRERVIILGAPYPLFTGDLPIGYDDRWDTDARVMIVQDKAMPLSVVALISEVSIS